jgi:hypothetical protein
MVPSQPQDPAHDRAGAPSEAQLSSDERSQIAARLRLTPAERLRYLIDIHAFEALARRARRIE